MTATTAAAWITVSTGSSCWESGDPLELIEVEAAVVAEVGATRVDELLVVEACVPLVRVLEESVDPPAR